MSDNPPLVVLCFVLCFGAVVMVAICLIALAAMGIQTALVATGMSEAVAGLLGMVTIFAAIAGVSLAVLWRKA